MGKAAMCMKMLQYLSTGQIWKASRLAEELETNVRNIIEYKKELEEAGYFITSISGKYGGYKLEKSCLFPPLPLNKNENKALNNGYAYLMEQKDFFDKKNLELAIGKIQQISHFNLDTTPIMVVEKENYIFDSNELENKYNLIKNALNSSHRIRFKYTTNQNKIREKLIEPYELYIFNSNWFVFGYVSDLDSYSSFKLIRMTDVADTKVHFSKDPYYKKSEYFDEAGFKKNDEWYDVELKITGYPLVKIKEQEIGKNQEIEFLSDKEAIVKARMQYKFNIVSFVLGMGQNCKVLSPEWLKNDVISALRKTVDMYQEN